MLDIHDSKQMLEFYLNRLDSCNMSDFQKEKIKRFVEEAQLGKNSKKKVGDRRLIANLQSFFRIHNYFKKDFDKLTEKELETFYKDLEHDRIKQQNGSPYKSSSKDELIRNLKRYLKWIWDEEKYKKLASWMREAEAIPEIPAISYEQAKQLSSRMKFLRDKCITLFLFDSGLRIEECLNLKIKDIELKKKADGDEFYIVSVDGKKTKLAKRRLSVPLASSILTEWLKEHPAIMDKEAYLFPITYDALRKVLRINSKDSLGFSVTAHQLRHSSATHYAKNNKLSWAAFCYRYGWDLNSDVPKRYIQREKLDESLEELDNIIKQNKTQELEEEILTLRKALNNEITQIKKQIEINEKQRKMESKPLTNTELKAMLLSKGIALKDINKVLGAK